MARERTPINHRWQVVGPDAAAYCQDCKKPANAVQHLTRADHHIYVCPTCAADRLDAEPIQLSA